MIIGFDAKRAFLNSTGLGNYSRTLIEGLAHFFPENQYKLFTPQETSLFSVHNHKNISIHKPQTFPSTIFKSAWRSAWMVKDLVREKVEIFHGLSHEIPRGIQYTNIKSVVTIHDLIHERYPNQYKSIDRKIYTNKFKFACENANKIIAISEQTKKDIIEIYGINSDKIEVIYQTADSRFLQRFSTEKKDLIRKKYQLPERFLLSVGSIIERKNLLQTVRALKETEEIKLVVVGDGHNYKQKVKDFISKNNLSERVIFLNEKYKIKNEELPLLYQLSSGLIYISSYEGFGLPVLEAIMSGIPVITSNLSCLPEAGGDCALYVDPFNISEISTQMQHVYSESETSGKLTESYKNHLTQFDSNLISNRIHHAYLNLV